MLDLEVIGDADRLIEIRDEWFSFAQTIKGLTPFQLPHWLLMWWSHFGNGNLHVLVFRHLNRIAAVIPCFRHEWNGRRQLTLIGSGISDYLEPAISSEHVPDILDGIQSHLASDPNWDMCDWQDLSGDTPLKRVTSSATLQAVLREDTVCTEIPISGGFEEFWRSLPKQLRQNCRRDKRRAETTGTLEFETTQHVDPELLNALIHLHGARWHRSGETGVIAQNRAADFLRDIAVEFANLGILQFFTLRIERELVAILLCFLYANTVFFYLSGFDPERETLGVGRLLLWEALRYCFQKEYSSWNFLRGTEDYKFQWGAQATSKCRLIVTNTK
ncbi:MAG: GNAT family N-acetyltransferase [Acidobacteriaceae bacterium]|nr:GNAT family N-acetyltransferase [Acidobacteriaceae bacterium]